MPDVKPLYLDSNGDHAELDPSSDYIKAAGVSIPDPDNPGQFLTVEMEAVAEQFVQEKFTITAAQALAKSITLSKAPKYNSPVIMIIRGGGLQTLGEDFNLTDQYLVWSGLGLDGILLENDVVSVNYTV